MIKSRLRKDVLTEATVSGKTIVSVDIQPEYKDYITFIPKWIDFINSSADNNSIVFLYNGPELGMITEQNYKYWLLEQGINEDVIDTAKFFDKGYAYFRYCMDESIDDEQIVHLIKFMIANNVNDSRDMDKDAWKNFIKQYGSEDVRELMQQSDEMIYIPDLMDFIKRFSNIVLVGGGITECLKEVELALMALDKPYKVLSKYTY